MFGVGGKGSSEDCLEWGSPLVSDCLRGSVRRVANRLQRERKWDLVLELVEHMETSKGIEECEGVLGLRLGEVGRAINREKQIASTRGRLRITLLLRTVGCSRSRDSDFFFFVQATRTQLYAAI